MSPRRGEGERAAWLKERADYQGDECLLWPFSLGDDGYGHLSFEGQHCRAHWLMCWFAHGRPPTKKYQSAHECRNRACVNPRHLSWKTQKENSADMVRHGTARFGKGRPHRKLTAEQAREILAMKGTRTQREIASMYGITHKQVSKIHLGLQWKGGVAHKPGGSGPYPEPADRTISKPA